MAPASVLYAFLDAATPQWIPAGSGVLACAAPPPRLMALEDRLAAGACPAPGGATREMRPRGKGLALSPHTGTWAPSERGCHAAVFIQEEPGREQECQQRPWAFLDLLGRGRGLLSRARAQAGQVGDALPLPPYPASSPERLRTLDSSTDRGAASGPRGERSWCSLSCSMGGPSLGNPVKEE